MEAKRNKTHSKSKLSQTPGSDMEGARGHRNNSVDSGSLFSDTHSSDTEISGSLNNNKSKKVIRTKRIIVPQDKFDILKHGHDRYSQVYSVEVSYLSEFLKNEDKNTNRVVLKIHDP